MSTITKTVEDSQDNLSEIVEVDTPRQVTELDAFMGVGSIYDPTTDTLEVNESEEEPERTRSVENSLITKYVVDETIGDTGIEELEELESQIERYRAIEGFDILEEEETEIRSMDEIQDDLIEEHGEDVEEFIEEVNEMGRDRDEEEEDTPSIEETRELEEQTEQIALDDLRMSIGEDEEITKRLAALHLSDDFDDVVEEYKAEYQDLEDKKEEARNDYWDRREQIWEELEDTVGDEGVLEAAVEVKTRAMEFDLETGMVDLNMDREMRGEETEKIGTGYTREDIAEAMRDKGVEDEEVIDRVYELFREEESIEEEKDEKIDQYIDRQHELYGELMDELDETAEDISQEIDLYIEPVNQREWKTETLPIKEIGASLQTLYKAHKDGLLDKPREEYEERMKAFVDQNYKSSGDIQRHLEKVVDLYQMQEGSEKDKLRATFERAPEYAS